MIWDGSTCLRIIGTPRRRLLIVGNDTIRFARAFDRNGHVSPVAHPKMESPVSTDHDVAH
jgi:hypothetical protein